MEIIDFILARIAEDEALADSVVDHRGAALMDCMRKKDPALAEFVERWSPWRIFSLCVLGRRLLAAHRPMAGARGEIFCSTCDVTPEELRWPCRTVLLLANEWNDHPDFRPEWIVGRRRQLRLV